jgi:hypothetical protein
MAYNTSFSFDSVAIIESLRPRDLRTGLDLFETTLAPASVLDPGFESELYEPTSARELFANLNAILENTRRYRRAPIIHIETHGNEKGIILRSGELVEWSDVASALAAINQASEMNLIVVAAMCHGWHMVSILRPTDRAPAFGIIGAPTAVSAVDLFRAMKKFYSALLDEPHDLHRGMSAANEGAPIKDWLYRMEGAELMLCRIFRNYFESLTTEETQPQRVSRLVADLARANGLDVVQTMQLRREITEKLDDHAHWFDHYRKHFLMLDLFPANGPRFPLRYEDCGEASV